jgi:hypothetical protein
MNIEDHTVTPLATVVEAIARHAVPLRAEVVGLVPQRALADFPQDVPLQRAETIEQALGVVLKTGLEND